MTTKTIINEYPHSSELLTIPSSFLFLDISRATPWISSHVSKIIKPPMGLYSNRDLDPVIDPDKVYFLSKGGGTYRGADLDFNYIFKNKINIIDAKTRKEVIIPTRKYSLSPFFPYVGIYLTAIWLCEELNDGYMYLVPKVYCINTQKYYDKLIGIDRKEASPEFLDDVLGWVSCLYSRADGIMSSLSKFIGDDGCTIFDISVDINKIRINKYCDFRIYEWSLNHEKELEQDE